MQAQKSVKEWHPKSIHSDLIPSKSAVMEVGLTNLAYIRGDEIKDDSIEIQKYKLEYERLSKQIERLEDDLMAFVDTTWKCQFLREVYERALNIGSAKSKKEGGD